MVGWLAARVKFADAWSPRASNAAIECAAIGARLLAWPARSPNDCMAADHGCPSARLGLVALRGLLHQGLQSAADPGLVLAHSGHDVGRRFRVPPPLVAAASGGGEHGCIDGNRTADHQRDVEGVAGTGVDFARV